MVKLEIDVCCMNCKNYSARNVPEWLKGHCDELKHCVFRDDGEHCLKFIPKEKMLSSIMNETTWDKYEKRCIIYEYEYEAQI